MRVPSLTKGFDQEDRVGKGFILLFLVSLQAQAVVSLQCPNERVAKVTKIEDADLIDSMKAKLRVFFESIQDGQASTFDYLIPKYGTVKVQIGKEYLISSYKGSLCNIGQKE